ncbi:hypothetical protein [Paraclostridium dentum]|uniref:hypothetical protein n=1 Tax=Paraclostridium dentum TaxID=2662455 RepID=UPI003F3CABCA
MSNHIQLKYTTAGGQVVETFPLTKPEFVEFSDGKTLLEKMNDVGNAHRHDLATASKDGFMSKADKAKLDGVTNYSHPSTHAPSVIAQDANNRFVTDTEKNNWNAKASTAVASTTANGLMSKEDKAKLDRVDNNFDIVYDSSTETINFRFK